MNQVGRRLDDGFQGLQPSGNFQFWTAAPNEEVSHGPLELYRDNLLPTARQTVVSYQVDYETDKATLLVLLSSQRNLRDLETMYYQDLSDCRVALAQLESLVGLGQKTSETGKSNLMGKMR